MEIENPMFSGQRDSGGGGAGIFKSQLHVRVGLVLGLRRVRSVSSLLCLLNFLHVIIFSFLSF
jgi:hypothetical protein